MTIRVRVRTGDYTRGLHGTVVSSDTPVLPEGARVEVYPAANDITSNREGPSVRVNGQDHAIVNYQHEPAAPGEEHIVTFELLGPGG